MLCPAGGSIIEQLVRCPPLRVRAWKLTSLSTRDVIRDTLLQVRNLAINNVVVMTTDDVTSVILDVVGSLQNLQVLKLQHYVTTTTTTTAANNNNNNNNNTSFQSFHCHQAGKRSLFYEHIQI